MEAMFYVSRATDVDVLPLQWGAADFVEAAVYTPEEAVQL